MSRTCRRSTIGFAAGLRVEAHQLKKVEEDGGLRVDTLWSSAIGELGESASRMEGRDEMQ